MHLFANTHHSQYGGMGRVSGSGYQHQLQGEVNEVHVVG